MLAMRRTLPWLSARPLTVAVPNEEAPRSVARYGQHIAVVRAERDARDGQRVPCEGLAEGLPLVRVVESDDGVLGRRCLAR